MQLPSKNDLSLADPINVGTNAFVLLQKFFGHQRNSEELSAQNRNIGGHSFLAVFSEVEPQRADNLRDLGP
jgi:hypothetical protein